MLGEKAHVVLGDTHCVVCPIHRVMCTDTCTDVCSSQTAPKREPVKRATAKPKANSTTAQSDDEESPVAKQEPSKRKAVMPVSDSDEDSPVKKAPAKKAAPPKPVAPPKPEAEMSLMERLAMRNTGDDDTAALEVLSPPKAEKKVAPKAAKVR